MTHEGLSKPVRDFILRYIQSVEQLETLLILAEEPGRVWTAYEISLRLNSNAQSISKRLANLTSSGLVEHADPDSAGGYRLVVKDTNLLATVVEIKKAYTERRISVIDYIFSQPMDRIRDFSDAFRLKREE